MKKTIAILLSVLLLFSAFPLTVFAEEEEEYVEPIQVYFLYTYDSFSSQAQGGTLPNGTMLDGDHPTAHLVFPPKRASGKRFLRWSGMPEIARQQDDGFTVLDLSRDDFTIGEDGSISSPYFSPYGTYFPLCLRTALP